ncbi:GFA family protein [Maritimibacter dapengensis]|uniref:GFA family protein n=1 Tax=Maritimibacter dapengensis TaxID=2836868 RepID=A0ABS6T1Q9_9RHOB|nr:GFA family protein [Maritimibacter dapengensis]MBV7379183.1 GFA family protein [Maritimibacter dapengensis]
MNEIHEGGCSCGAVRYCTRGIPQRTGVCHCRYCQTRTGSAFGISVYFDASQVDILSGDLADYSFTTESGRNFTTRFCKICGTTLFWSLDLFEGAIAIAGGTFDPPTFWYDVDREVFTRSQAPFVSLSVSHSHETTQAYAPKRPESHWLRTSQDE